MNKDRALCCKTWDPTECGTVSPPFASKASNSFNKKPSMESSVEGFFFFYAQGRLW